VKNLILQSRNEHRWLAVILTAFVILACIYSVSTPIFEAGDELWHYPFVQHLATGHSLPIQDPNVKTLWEQEGGQPPLYYVISALATFWIDTSDLPERLWLNPEARIGIPLDFGNKNMVVHTSAENFPWTGTTLAVHLIRLLSIILSTITVWLTYLFALEISSVIARSEATKQSSSSGLEIASDEKRPRNTCTARKCRCDMLFAAFAAAIVAFNPMFLFISASVNNDNLATMLATLSLLLLTRLITRGATMRQFIILGIVLGLGGLTKISNLGLLVVAAFVFAYLLWKEWIGRGRARTSAEKNDLSAFIRVHLRPIILGSLVSAALVVLIAFWWYVRNWIHYGDLLAFNVWVQIAGGRPTPVTLASLLGEFQGFRISFWGNFGGVNIIAPDWVYTVLDTFTIVALVGLLVGWMRRQLPGLLALPTLWIVFIAISLVRWTWLTMASQGRLIFPAISAVVVLIAWGIFSIQNSVVSNQKLRFTHYVLPFAFTFFLFTFALLSPFTLISPVYALPERLPSNATVPNSTSIVFDNQAELIGYQVDRSVKPGSELPITVYWRALKPMGEDYSVYIRLFDASGNIVGRWNAFPGQGLYPTRFWQTNEIVVDSYRVPVSLDAKGPNVGRVEVGLFRRVPLANLNARDPKGNAITPTIARFKIAGTSNVQIENPVSYDFGDTISLVGFSAPKAARAGESLRVKLFWRARAPIDTDYTVFVHLVDANGKPIAQKDNQPQGGAYPMSFLDVGETIADDYVLEIPRDARGEYRIAIGLYNAADGTRLMLKNGADHVEPGSVAVGF
jgi:hypothetical protein